MDKNSIELEVDGNHLRAFNNLHLHDPSTAVGPLIPPVWHNNNNNNKSHFDEE